jgi:hypothetical protein
MTVAAGGSPVGLWFAEEQSGWSLVTDGGERSHFSKMSTND